MTKLRIIGFNRIGFCFSIRDLMMPTMIPKAGIGIQAITEIAIRLRRQIHQNLKGLLGAFPDNLASQHTAGLSVYQG